jgi:hypothetical protein
MVVQFATAKRKRLLADAALLALVAMTLGIYTTFQGSPALAEDLKTFLAAAATLASGGNPYDPGQLVHQEWRMFPMDAAAQAWTLANPYVQGPLLLAILRPLVGFALSQAYAIWVAMLALCIAASIVIFIPGALRLPKPRRLAVALAVCPATFAGLLLGQSDAILLLALAGAMWCAARRSYAPAGILLTAGLIKPQIIAGAVVLFAILAYRDRALWRYTVGVACGVAGSIVFAIALGGRGLLSSWVSGLGTFGHGTVQAEPNISSLTVLYVGVAPHALAAVSVIAALVWLGAMAAMSSQLSGGPLARARWFGVGMVGWLLVTPYAHPHDDILLFPAIVTAIWLSAGRRWAWLCLGLFWTAWWLLPVEYLSPLFTSFPVDVRVRGFGIIPVTILLILLIAWKAPGVAAHSRV